MDKNELIFLMKYGHLPHEESHNFQQDFSEVEEVDESSLPDDVKEALREKDND